MENLIRLSQACKMLGVTRRTLISWDAEGKIRTVRTAGNQRRIPESEIARLQDIDLIEDKRDTTLVYARCSTEKQRENLERQTARLEEYCKAKGGKYEVYSEIGSGLNGNRKVLKKLIKRIARGDISEVVVEYEDRLTRYGFDYFVAFFNTLGIKVTVLEDTEAIEFEQELARDMVEVIASYSARLYGRRGGKKKAGVA